MILLGIFFLYTYHHYSANALEEASKDLENMCASVENSVETQLENISTISLNIVYSNAIKTNFEDFTNAYLEHESDPSTLVASREKVAAIRAYITAMIGAYQTASEIKLYTLDGYCAEVGFRDRISTVVLKDLSWYDETMALRGYKYISNPEVHKDLPAGEGNRESQKFISLTRLFGDLPGNPEGIVEVIQDCATIFSLASQLESQNPDSHVYVYNDRQELVYPYEPPESSENYDLLISEQKLPENTTRVIQAASGEELLTTYLTINKYGWKVILTKPKSAVYESLRSFRSSFTVIAVLSILFTLGICMYISQRMTAPLLKLTAATGKITINRVLDEKKVNLTSADSNIKELSMLCESIRNMYEKLRATSQEVLLSHSEETRAKLQATQSLINPHFLYNCLTNMSIMAEEEMNEDIIKMCHALCDYFRYISSSKEMIVTLDEEIFYTKRYLECMKLRFNEELNFILNITDEAKEVYIPKLIVQPVVENAFKYAFQISPPWELKITAHTEAGRWILIIQDNGGTMTEEKKMELLHLYKNLDLNEELKSMQIGGMGLKNVYLRLKLLYGENAVFQIDSSQPGKTIFILGGPAYLTREEYYAEHPHL